jgi:hypothetical protein
VDRAVGGSDGFRAQLRDVCRHIEAGHGERDDMKFAELPYFLEAAEHAGFDLPLSAALYRFCDRGPREWKDNMGRPYVSFWHMLQQPGHTEQSGR